MADPVGDKSETLQPVGKRHERRPDRGIILGGLALLASLAFVLSYEPTRQSTGASIAASGRTQEKPSTGYEPTDWRVGWVGLVFAGTFLLLVITPFVLMLAFPNALPDVGRNLRIAPPGPRLQVDPRRDLTRFRAKEEKRLNTYYWIDKQKGVVHIPIRQAMSKLVKTGIPGFPKAQQ